MGHHIEYWLSKKRQVDFFKLLLHFGNIGSEIFSCKYTYICSIMKAALFKIIHVFFLFALHLVTWLVGRQKTQTKTNNQKKHLILLCKFKFAIGLHLKMSAGSCTLNISTLRMQVNSYTFSVTQSKSLTHCSLPQVEKAPCLDHPPHQTDRVWV